VVVFITLENLRRRKQTVKKYFDKKDKIVTFGANEKALLWDSTHTDKGKHSKF
jgi:hypothetical protein